MLAVLQKLWPLLVARAGNGDNVSAVVRTARGWYTGTFSMILLAWYTSWRNKRTPDGNFTKWPIPGLSKEPETNSASRSDPDVSSYDGPVDQSILDPTSVTDLGALPGAIPTQDLGPTPAHTGSQSTSLYNLAVVATQHFKLRVSEYPPFGPVHQVHSANSWHYKGKAFDCSGPPAQMQAFASYVKTNYGRTVTELIHNPGFSIKNGQVVPPSYWGSDVWANHRNHVHVAIAR